MGTWELKGTSFNSKLKVSFYFLLSPSPTESLPFTSIMDGYTWTTSLYTKILSLKKVQEDSQESGRNKGGLQTLDLLSQNYQLETYRMTLKSRRVSQSLQCNSRLASSKASTESCQRGFRKAVA